MSNDINHLDTEDLGLKAIFGDRFQDQTVAPKVQKKTEGDSALFRQPQGTATVPKGEGLKKAAADAQWEPAKAVTSMDKLISCAKWAGLFGGLNGLLFYWQQAGLLASEAAVPSMVVCALLAGLSIGWHAK